MRIGAHLDYRFDIQGLFEVFSDLSCIQTFLGDPQGYRVNEIDDKLDLQGYLYEKDKWLYVHASYVVNLASTKHAAVSKSANYLNKLLMEIRDLNSSVIFHVGKLGTLNNFVTNIDDLISQRGDLIMENAAGQGSEIGTTYNDFRRIFEATDRVKGLCIDTQHLYAAGVCSFESEYDVIGMFDNLRDFPLRVIHLNDSLTSFGSRKDRHAALLEGKIWNVNTLKVMVNLCKEESIDIIVETDKVNQDISTIRNLIKT